MRLVRVGDVQSCQVELRTESQSNLERAKDTYIFSTFPVYFLRSRVPERGISSSPASTPWSSLNTQFGRASKAGTQPTDCCITKKGTHELFFCPWGLFFGNPWTEFDPKNINKRWGSATPAKRPPQHYGNASPVKPFTTALTSS